MSERTRNGKTFAQDALGIFFCIVGGFFAVSIVLFLGDQQPKPGLVSALTAPVIELAALLGSPAALFFSVSLAVLGTLLFLRNSHLSATRPLLALVAGSLGVSLIFGAFGGASVLGGWLPGLVPGFVGRILALVLGVALAWLGWTLVAGERAARSSTAELMPRIAPRHEASGVSQAEAALLVSDPRTPAARPAPRREAAAPLRDETIRPFPPTQAPAAPRAARTEAPSKPARPVVSPLEVGPIHATESVHTVPVQTMPEPASGAGEASLSVLTPPAPSWEGVPEEVQEEEEETAQRLSEALNEEFETEEASAIEEEEEEVEKEEEEEAEVEPADEDSTPAAPRASWEQIGLFDEEEELEEEAPPVKPAKVELTPAFDFEASEPKKPAHEPESLAEESSSPAPAVAPGASWEDVQEKDDDEEEVAEDEKDEEDEEREVPGHAELETSVPAVAAPAVPTKQEFVLKPVAAPVPAPAPASVPRPEPKVTLVAEGEGWSKLVYDAGCVILEQKRVAVSMLERRFGIDFDQACRVLDELQQAGLIGPYMGGRTRDILLTREQWLPHAPHAT